MDMEVNTEACFFWFVFAKRYTISGFHGRKGMEICSEENSLSDAVVFRLVRTFKV